MVAIDVYTLTLVKLWHKYTISDFDLLYGEPQPRAVLLTTPEQFQDEDFLKCHLIVVTLPVYIFSLLLPGIGVYLDNFVLPDFEEHFKAEVNPITFLVGGKTNEMTYFESCELGFLQKKMQFLRGPSSHET
ncbi:hypothetical protein PR048_032158, partial [Dryococelus australis]